MPIAVDTNVLLPALRGGSSTSVLVSYLERLIPRPGLVLSAPVYAELAAAPGVTPDLLDRFLHAGQMRVDFDLARDLWLQAAAAYRAYADRRHAEGAGWPRRLLADCVIGAHAALHADALLTYNGRDFGRLFPDLDVVEPPVVGEPS